MKNTLRKAIFLGLAGLLVHGCGSSESSFSSAAPAPAAAGTFSLSDIERSLRFAPSDMLNLRQANGTRLAVADLETDYETLFGSLSDQLGVTLKTPEVVNDILFIAQQQGTGYFNLFNKPILNNGLGISHVAFRSLEYETSVPLPAGNQSFHVSGGLLLPLGISGTQLKGVIVYFHGTTFSKDQVPSNYGANVETQLLAEVFASQGYVVVMPDYVGQGVDWQDVHPYVLYPKASAKTAADMLAAVKPSLAQEYGISAGDAPLKLFSVGYSEGGAYSLWFNQFLSSNPGLLDPFYQLTHSVGLEGAYNVSSVTIGYLFDDVRAFGSNNYQIQTQQLTNLVKPAIAADVFLSYAAYSLASDFTAVFNSDFFALTATDPVPQSVCNFNGVQLNMQQAFAQPNVSVSTQVVAAALKKSNNGKTYPGPVELVLPTTFNNSGLPLVNANINDPNFVADLNEVLTAADVDLSAVPDKGVTIVSLDQDSVVTPNNFDDLASRFPNKILNSYKVDHTKLQVVSPQSKPGQVTFIPTDHLHALIYEYLYALNTFNQF